MSFLIETQYGSDENNIGHKNLWDIKTPSNCSWGWRGILNGLGEAIKHVQHLIGDREQTLFWRDPWLPCGGLLDMVLVQCMYDLGMGMDVKVSAFISGRNWVIPPSSSNDLLEIYELILQCSNLFPEFADEIVWKTAQDANFSRSTVILQDIQPNSEN